MSLFVWYFGTKRKYPDVAHHTILLGPALQGAARRHLRAQGARRRLQPLPAPPHATDPSMAPPAATPSTCCRRCRTSTRASTGRSGRAVPQVHRGTSRARCCPGSRGPRRQLARAHPAGLPGRPPVLQGRGVRDRARAHAERVLPPAQPERGRRRALPRGRGHPPRRGHAGRALVGARARHGGARCRCREILRVGSKSFHAASLLLPERVREPASVVYAFCRVSDDAVDLVSPRESPAAVERLRGRLARVYEARPDNHPVDRALTVVVERHGLPRAVPEALLDGFAWDVEGRRYESREALYDYCARVAGTVGRDDDRADGPTRRGHRRPRVRPRRGDAAHQHLPRRGRRRAQRPGVPPPRHARRGGPRPRGARAGPAGLARPRRGGGVPPARRRPAVRPRRRGHRDAPPRLPRGHRRGAVAVRGHRRRGTTRRARRRHPTGGTARVA
jgi:hypothetical protein